ncbi:MAG: hypothetical protein QM755_13785 [Luteolibacter sp.]
MAALTKPPTRVPIEGGAVVWEIPALGTASRRFAFVPVMVWLIGGGILFCSDVGEFRTLLLVPLGVLGLGVLLTGLAFRWYQKRRASITRRLVVDGEAAILFEERSGWMRETRLPVEKIRRVRQMRFHHSFCWGVEIIGPGQVSLRVETPWSQEEVMEFTREVKAEIWGPNDPRASLP